MPKKKQERKVGSSGRFGPRYGTRVRARVKSVEERAKGFHRCPECESKKVKRVGSGIWECKRCGTKFAAKAYSPVTTTIEKRIDEESEIPVTKEEEEE